MWQIVPPSIPRLHPRIALPYLLFMTTSVAYDEGTLDDESVLAKIAREREWAGGDMEFRPGFFDILRLSRAARQALHAERKRERERKRASNGSVLLGLVEATLLTPSF